MPYGYALHMCKLQNMHKKSNTTEKHCKRNQKLKQKMLQTEKQPEKEKESDFNYKIICKRALTM